MSKEERNERKSKE